MGFEEEPAPGGCRRPGEGEAAFVRSGEEEEVVKEGWKNLGRRRGRMGGGGTLVGRRQWRCTGGRGEAANALLLTTLWFELHQSTMKTVTLMHSTFKV